MVTSSLPSRIVGATDIDDDSIIHWVRTAATAAAAPTRVAPPAAAPRIATSPSRADRRWPRHRPDATRRSARLRRATVPPCPPQGLVEEGKGPVQIGEEWFVLKRVASDDGHH